MIYRTFAVLIVAFWITMSVLLIYKEVKPQDSAVREVPVSHVVKLMLHHEQSSDLHVYGPDRQRIGHLRIQPKTRRTDGQRVVETTGNLQISMPGADRQRLAWAGSLEMDKLLNVSKGRLTVGLREPSPLTVELEVEPPKNQLSYETRNGDQVLARGSYTLDEKGMTTWMQEQGIDPVLLNTVHRPNTPGPLITAHQSSMPIRNEKVDTYLVKVEQNGQTLLEMHVSQLGQILKAKFLGYWAAPEDITY